jgi:WD40 repeat protein
MFRNYEDDDDRQIQTAAGTYKVPDRDFYRKNFNAFSSVCTYLESRIYSKSFRNRTLLQPHFCALKDVVTPYGNISNPSDGVCAHFLRRGFTKPEKTQFNDAVWSADGRWLVLGSQAGDLLLWESETLKVHKLISLPAHKEFYGDGDRIKENIPITAMTWKNYGNILVTGDQRGLIQYCDETFCNILVTKDAHASAIRGLSFSPMDAKLASCRLGNQCVICCAQYFTCLLLSFIMVGKPVCYMLCTILHLPSAFFYYSRNGLLK